MFQRHTRIYAAASALLTAGALALTGAMAASAAPAGHIRPAVSGRLKASMTFWPALLAVTHDRTTPRPQHCRDDGERGAVRLSL